jgi:hypothetical protein
MSYHGQYVNAADGLEWQGIGYGKQRFGLGAVTQTPLFNYRAAAEPLATASFAKTPGANRVVVTMEVDGKSPVVMPFSDTDVAGDAFEEVIATPGKRAYVGLFERAGIIGEQHFAAVQHVETRFSFEKLKDLAPWIIGGAVVIAGAVYFSKRRGKGRRRRAGWRRRTVTVWR